MAAPEPSVAEGSATESTQRRTSEQTSATAPRGAFAALGGTLIGAAANFAMLAVVVRSYGAEAFGVFSGLTALFLVLTMITRFGADQGSTWYVARLMARGRKADAVGLVRAALIPVLIGSVVVAITVFYSSGAIARRLTDAERVLVYIDMLRVVAVAIPLAALGEVLLGITRGFGSMRPTVVGSQLGRQVGQLAMVSAAAVFSDDLRYLAFAWVAPYLLTIVYPLWWLARVLAGAGGGGGTPWEEFWRYSGAQAANQSAQIGLEKLDIILLAPLGTVAAQAAYSGANRLAHLAVLALYALNLSHGGVWARLFEARRYDQVSTSARTITVWGALLVSPLLWAFITFGDVWTALFGDGLDGGASLAILSAGLLVVMLIGPSEGLLLMSGGSARALVHNVGALVLNIGLNVVLIGRFGGAGAAIAWVTSLVLVRSLAAHRLRLTNGVTAWSLPALAAVIVSGLTYGLIGLGARLVVGDTLAGLIVSLVLCTPLYLGSIWLLRRSFALPSVAALIGRASPSATSPSSGSPAHDVHADGVAEAPRGDDHRRWVDGPHLQVMVRSGASHALPLDRAGLKLLTGAVPASGWKGRLLRTAHATFAPLLGDRAHLLPRFTRRDGVRLPFDPGEVNDIVDEAIERLGLPVDAVLWLLPPAQTEPRFGALLLVSGAPVAHLRVLHGRERDHERPAPTHARGIRSGVEWPVVLDRWLSPISGLQCELTTALRAEGHRPAKLANNKLLDVADDICDALGGPGPSGAVPMHGDLTPWNLRVTSDGRLLLFDWEHAAYGPPDADLARYLATSPDGLRRAETLPRSRRANLVDAARFWLFEREMRSFGDTSAWKVHGRNEERRRLHALVGDSLREEPEGDVWPRQGWATDSMLPASRSFACSDPPQPLRLVDAIVRFRRVVALCALGGMAAGLVVGLPGWLNSSATANVVLTTPWGVDPAVAIFPVGSDSRRFVVSQATVFQGIPAVGDLSSVAVPDALTVRVTMTAPSAARASDQLDSVIRAYANYRRATVRSEVARGRESIADAPNDDAELREALEQAATRREARLFAYDDGIAFVERFDVQRSRSSLSLALVGLTGLGVGLTIAFSAALILAALRPRVRDVSVVTRYSGAAVLGRRGDAPTTTALILGHLLGRAAPRHGALAHAVMVVEAGSAHAGSTPWTASPTHELARAARACGAVVLVAQPPAESADMAEPAPLDFEGDHDLVLISCPPPSDHVSAIRLARRVDLIVVVVAENTPVEVVDDLVGRFNRVDAPELAFLFTSG